jgi:glyoxylase-like metal-dependent hydrolase (beta-lactamase superfamily II)
MNLEDHVGDVLRKARQAAGVSAETAARAAGLTANELGELEAAGRTRKPANWLDLAAVLKLNGPKLKGIAEGWLPEARDLSLWRELRIITTERGGNSVNCGLIWDEVSREAALFDTGWDAQPVFDLVEENGLALKHLFLTHSHQDHVAALEPIRHRFPKLLLHSGSKAALPQHRNKPGEFVHLGSLRLSHRDLPGHAEDGVVYLVGGWPEDAPHVAFVGDTVFAGSLATGFQSATLLKQKVRDEIFSLPPETLLCPGHGPVTTVAEERNHNPFF